MQSSPDVVMLVTHSGDYFTVDKVDLALRKRGAKVFRLDTDQFPQTVRLAAHISNYQNSYRLEYGNFCVSSEQVQAVWMRRIWKPQLGKELAPEFQAACTQESMATLDNFWDSLRQARWVDPLPKINIAENKLRQLRVATEVGLNIPRTLITNNSEEARNFFDKVEGKMIAKLIKPLSVSMKGDSVFLYTSKVKEEDLKDAESLSYSPMIFQEQISKAEELRVVVVNGNFFVGSLCASKYAASTLDWRNTNSDIGSWQSYQLPEEIVNKLNAFMAKFELTFGVFDFIKTVEGEYVFLEINPVGEWGMLERDLDFHISEVIADTLLV